MKKVAIFAFQGEPMCFAHVLLYTLELKTKGFDVRLIIEGMATKMVKELADESKPFAGLYSKVKAAGLIEAVCKACANQTGSLSAAEAQGLRIVGDMSGHPSLANYIEQGYQIVMM